MAAAKKSAGNLQYRTIEGKDGGAVGRIVAKQAGIRSNIAGRAPAKQNCSVKTKKMEPIIGIDEEGEARRRAGTEQRDGTSYKRSAAWNEVTATDKQVRIAYWRQPISKALIQDKNSGETGFARCFWRVSEQFSRILAKKMEPIIGIEPMTCSLRVSCSTD